VASGASYLEQGAQWAAPWLPPLQVEWQLERDDSGEWLGGDNKALPCDQQAAARIPVLSTVLLVSA